VKVTGTTITDEQLEEVHDMATALLADYHRAHDTSRTGAAERKRARERLAAVWTSRSIGASP
jgi:hypothetical protein